MRSVEALRFDGLPERRGMGRAAPEELRQRLAEIGLPEKPPDRSRMLATGWDRVDEAIGGLPRGVVHEWIGEGWGTAPGRWHAPVGVLMHLARRAVGRGVGRGGGGGRGLVVWVGAESFAFPPALMWGDGELAARSVMVEARSAEERAWAIDVALRSRGVEVVIGDVSGTRMAESRRFQLSASAGGGMGLLVRPPGELGEISAAWSRWRVSPAGGMREGVDQRPGWALELLRCKGTRPVAEGARRWAVRMDDETGDVHLVSDARDRRAEASGAETIDGRRIA